MHAADAGGDYLRLVEHYRQMKDPELLILSRDSAGLTDLARQALESEMHQRGLQPEPEEQPPIPDPPESFSADVSQAPDPYEEDRKLVDLCTVWSQRDALQLQTLLDRAGVPFFIGPENATGIAEITSNFANGLRVQVMRIGIPWTRLPMSNYFPKDAPPEVVEEEPEELSTRCPKCQSEEVIFNGLVAESPDDAESSPSSSTTDPSQKFDWKCDSCGYEWKDDGVARNQ